MQALALLCGLSLSGVQSYVLVPLYPPVSFYPRTSAYPLHPYIQVSCPPSVAPLNILSMNQCNNAHTGDPASAANLSPRP